MILGCGITLEAKADDYVSKDGKWEYSGSLDETNEIGIYHYFGTEENLIIPEMIDGYVVKEIYSLSYDENDEGELFRNIKSVTFPKSVTYVSSGALGPNVTTVNAPEIVYSEYFYDSYIGQYISDNKLLVGIIKQPGLTRINVGDDSIISENGVLYTSDMKTLLFVPRDVTSFVVPETVEIIGNCAFAHCERLEHVALPNKLIQLSGSAFLNCKKLDNVVLPQGTTKIFGRTFEGCSSLKNIVIPSAVIEYHQYAFKDCSSLEEIVINEGEYCIDVSTFEGCTYLKKVKLPSTVTRICKSAFEGCTNLQEINIPESVTAIEEHAFRECVNLTKLELSANVSYIDSFAFWLCDKLDIAVPKGSYAEKWIMYHGYSSQHIHDYSDDFEVIKKATCSSTGKKTVSCTCGDVSTIDIPKDKNNHTGNEEVKGRVEAKQRKEGYSGDTYCKDCGVKIASGKTIPALPVDSDYSVKPSITKQTITCAKVKNIKAKNVSKKDVKINLKAKTSGNGKITYKVIQYPKKAKKYVSVSKKGVLVLKKGAKKGTYKICITAAKTDRYDIATKYITFKIK